MLFSIFLLSIMLSSVSSSDHLSTFCAPDKKNYTDNDEFGTNLKRLLNNLSANTMRDNSIPGFYNAIEGERSEVYGQALCRGDVIDSATCQSCVKNASQDILEKCKSKDAIIWYELCQVRYSFQNFFSLMTYTGKYPDNDHLKKEVSDQDQFREVLKNLMDNITNEAEFMPFKRMFATGQVRFLRNETIYGLVQCTSDISSTLCGNCLKFAWGDLDACCSFRRGGFVVSRTCNVRFELYQFYNDTSSFYSMRKENKWKIRKIAIAIIASVSLLAIFLCSCALFLLRKRGSERDHDMSEHALLRELASRTTVTISDEGKLLTSEELPFFDLTTIRAATDDFANSKKLGQGGFGTVYKGVFPDGKEVAVKRLSRKSWQGLEEFKNEVILIAKLQHRNLTRLVGFSVEGEEKLLLYEFMPNRSLDFYIFDPARRSQLDWEMYYNIISGIARGLLYLHEDSRLKVIHRDLKPNNILLDHEMVAKLSDFGMARIFCENQNTANTKRIVGTFGYMAPEYAMGGIFSVKSDVFSFGVILLEIISGKKNTGFHLTEHAQTLISYAWRLWKEGKELEFVDPVLLMAPSCPKEEVRRLIHIGLLCVQEDPKDRPTMTDVVVLLPRSESIISLLPEPREPAFAVGRVVGPSHHPNATLNGLTLSDILPR